MKNEKFTVGFKYCDWNQDLVTLVGFLAILVPMHTTLDCIACVVSLLLFTFHGLDELNDVTMLIY